MKQLIYRVAEVTDADGISGVLQDLVAAGKRRKPGDPEFTLSHYITDPDQIICTVAIDSTGRILGFQSLKRATENNRYGAPQGWGVIGTHIRPSAARLGIGRTLFDATQVATRCQGLPAIDATINARNVEGLAYYEAMGFRDYRTSEGVVSKVFWLS